MLKYKLAFLIGNYNQAYSFIQKLDILQKRIFG